MSSGAEKHPPSCLKWRNDAIVGVAIGERRRGDATMFAATVSRD
jgi:hypothetical protein